MFGKMLDDLQLELLWKNPGRAISVYERIPRAWIDGFRLANLKNSLKLAREKAPFYAQKFREHPVDLDRIRSTADLGPIFTTPSDLQTLPPEQFLCGRADTAFETTGTFSKRPKRVLFSTREIQDVGRVNAAGLWRMGIRPEDRIASSFDYSFWVSGPTLKAAVEQIKCFHVEAGRIDPEEFYERVKPYRCNVIVADPGWLVRLSEIAERLGPWPVKLLIAGGENLTEASRRYIESVWKAKMLLSYGQTEAFGSIGIECHRQDGYHLNDMDLWAEVVDTDAHGYGELVYTTLRRTVMPFVRYRSGDITRLITEPCPCGTPSVRLAKLRGRADEMVVTGVGNIAAWMIEPAIESLKPRVADWQLAVRRTGAGNKDLLELRVEADPGVSGEDLRQQLMKTMKGSPMGTAVAGIEQGLSDFCVSLLKPGEIKGNSRKIKRTIDLRNFDKI
jgi:phenylacetate-CoA ligase